MNFSTTKINDETNYALVLVYKPFFDSIFTKKSQNAASPNGQSNFDY